MGTTIAGKPDQQPVAVGRPSHKPKKFYASFRYRAGSWDQTRRVLAKVEWHAGELFSPCRLPRH
jgi:hypothetical protein